MKESKTTKETRQRIVDAFCTLLEKKELRKITVKQITDLAGLHRNSFYCYFCSTYDLVGYMEDVLAERMIAYLDSRMIGAEKSEVKEAFIKILNENERFFRLLILRADETNFSSALRKRLFPHQNSRYHFADDPVLNEYIIEYILAGSLATIERYFRNQGEISPDLLVDIDMNLVFSDLWSLSSVKDSAEK